MTFTVIIMIVIGVILSIASFFISEKLTQKESSTNTDLFTVDDDYEFSERELRIIKRKIEDVIADQARDILYETNDSLSSMANEKTLALGDYAVTVCEEIERNHKEVMFLYSMLDDKQKEIMNTVKTVDETNRNVKELISQAQRYMEEVNESRWLEENKMERRLSAIDQLTALSQKKKETATIDNTENRTTGLKYSYEQKMPEQYMDELSEKVPTEVEQTTTMMESMPAADLNTADVFQQESMMAVDVQQFTDDVESEEPAMEDVFAELDQAELGFDDVLEEEFEEKFEEEFEESGNSNDIILAMYHSGNSIIEIAKQLGLGVGEVKLVIDLYRGEWQ